MDHRLTGKSHDVLGRDPDVVEDQLGGVRGPHAQLVDDLLAHRVAFHAPLDDEGGNLWPSVCIFTCLGIDHANICWGVTIVNDPVRYPHLPPIQQPASIALLDRRGVHAKDVGSVPRLAHAHAAYPLPAADEGKDPGFLVLGPIEGQIVDHELGVGEVGEAESGVGVGKLLIDDRDRGGVHSNPSIRLVNGDPVEAEAPKLPEEVRVEPLKPVVLKCLGLDLLEDEIADHVPEHAVLLGRVCDVEPSIHDIWTKGLRMRIIRNQGVTLLESRGKGMVSRMWSAPASQAHTLSTPSPKPPWGTPPYLLMSM